MINLYTQAQYQEALDKATTLLKAFSNSVILYNIVGVVYQNLDKFDEAIEAFKSAISIKPDYAEAYYNMGNTFQQQRELDEAIEAFKAQLVLSLIMLRPTTIWVIPSNSNVN